MYNLELRNDLAKLGLDSEHLPGNINVFSEGRHVANGYLYVGTLGSYSFSNALDEGLAIEEPKGSRELRKNSDGSISLFYSHKN